MSLKQGRIPDHSLDGSIVEGRPLGSNPYQQFSVEAYVIASDIEGAFVSFSIEYSIDGLIEKVVNGGVGT
jgi:hypothetical protein